MISGFLKKKKNDATVSNELEDLFARPIRTIVEEPEKKETEVVEGLETEEDAKLSAIQIKERNERTVFVGNVDIDLEAKHLKKHFAGKGKIEKVWFRSVPVESNKIPVKGNVALKKFIENAPGKNAYILFSTKEEAEGCLNLNGTKIKNNHLRVDLAVQKKLDYNQTIFIGNLPFVVGEEDLRNYFNDCGQIDNIRIIRDPKTHIGKGIGYITFGNEAAFKKGLAKNGKVFKDRELRIKKAVPAERLEKKMMKKEQMKQNAARRLKVKPDPEDEIKEEDMKKFVKQNKEIKDKNIEDLELKNEIKSTPGVIRKRIKKIEKRNGTVNKMAVVKKENLKTKKKNDRELFNGRDEMKIRREKRRKQTEINRKKFANQKLDNKK